MRRCLLGGAVAVAMLLPNVPALSAGPNPPGPQQSGSTLRVGQTAQCPGELGLWNPGPAVTNYSGGRLIIDAYQHQFNTADSCFQRSHQSLFFAITGTGTPYFELVFFNFPDGKSCFLAYGQNNDYVDNGTNRGCDTPLNLPTSGQYELRGLHTGSNVWEFSYRYRSSASAAWGAWVMVDRWNTGVSYVKRIFAESSGYVSSDMAFPQRSTNFSGIQVRRASDAVWANAGINCATDLPSGTFNIATDNDPLYALERASIVTVGQARVIPGSGHCV